MPMAEYRQVLSDLGERFPRHFIPDNLIRHPAGFYQVNPMPDSAELEAFYRDKYFQSSHGNYKKHYHHRDQRHRHNRLLLRYVALNVDPNTNHEPAKMLDIGCGEGWAMRWFADKGWQVTGVDFSDAACREHNPELAKKIHTGNVADTLLALIESNRARFDVIWLTNVLEHAPDPEWLLSQIHTLSTASGQVLVEVPNDFSITQQAAARQAMIQSNFWFCPPEHLNYFDLTGLSKLMQSCGWAVQDAFSDFPIDWFLMHEHANYIAHNSRGTAAHAARELIESEMIRTDVHTTLALYRNLAQLGMGRNITVLANRDEKNHAHPL